MNLGFMFSVSTYEMRDDWWGAHLIHPLPDEPGIHILGEYLVMVEEMMGGELISFILYQMNLGFMFSVSTWLRRKR